MGLRKLVHRSTSKDLRQSIIVSPSIQKSKVPAHHTLPLHQSITVSMSIKKSNPPAPPLASTVYTNPKQSLNIQKSNAPAHYPFPLCISVVQMMKIPTEEIFVNLLCCSKKCSFSNKHIAWGGGSSFRVERSEYHVSISKAPGAQTTGSTVIPSHFLIYVHI